MALKKIINSANGITTEYHKIYSISLSKIPGHDKDYNIAFVIDSYVSPEIRQKGVTLVAKRNNFSAIATLDEIISKPIIELTYEKAKALPEFENAEDC